MRSSEFGEATRAFAVLPRWFAAVLQQVLNPITRRRCRVGPTGPETE
jgi:hypothetical protein